MSKKDRSFLDKLPVDRHQIFDKVLAERIGSSRFARIGKLMAEGKTFAEAKAIVESH
jgi:hypothetical protein